MLVFAFLHMETKASKIDTCLNPHIQKQCFDKHLRPIEINVDSSAKGNHNTSGFITFPEDTHWHNTRPLDPKKSLLSPADLLRYRRRSQFYRAEMQWYAESLQGFTSGHGPEMIVVGPSPKLNQSQQSRQKTYLPKARSYPSSSKRWWQFNRMPMQKRRKNRQMGLQAAGVWENIRSDVLVHKHRTILLQFAQAQPFRGGSWHICLHARNIMPRNICGAQEHREQALVNPRVGNYQSTYDDQTGR